MTSPRQRKKMAALLARNKKTQKTKSEPLKTEQKPQTTVATTTSPVVESAEVQQFKKKLQSKNALVETKTQETKTTDQVVEQPKTEVKTESKE